MPQAPKTLLSIVVPLYNEESNINSFYKRLKQLEQKLSPIELELILVDDCSQDKTAALARELCLEDKNVRLIRFAKNSGSHAAIMAGVVASRGDCVMFLAGDLQDPPEIVPELLHQWRSGNSIVWAARKELIGAKKKDSFFSSMYWLMVHYCTRLPIPRTGVDFFLIDRKVAEAVAPRHHCNVPYFQLVAETGFKSTVVYYTKASRAGGKSGWTLKKKLTLVLETLLFSPTALRAFTASGMVFAVLGVLTALVTLACAVITATLPSQFSLMLSAMSFFSGLQMTMLGFVGEYLYVTLKEARKAPRYVIAETVNSDHRVASLADSDSLPKSASSPEPVGLLR